MTDKVDPQLMAIRNKFDISGHKFFNNIVTALKVAVKEKVDLSISESGKSMSGTHLSINIGGQFTPEDAKRVKDTIDKFMNDIRNPHNFVSMVKKYHDGSL